MRNTLMILIIVLTGLLVACSDTTNSEEEKDKDKAESGGGHATVERSLEDILDQFPDDHVAERVITTSVPIAEMLAALDIMPTGVPTSTNPLPEEFANVDEIGSPMAPDLEKITDLESDLLLSSAALEDSLEESLESIDLERAYLPTDSFEDLKMSLEALGIYFEKEAVSGELLEKIESNEEQLKAELADVDLPSVLLIIGTDDSFMVMSEESYLGSLIATFGAENIASTTLNVTDRYSPVNMESIVEADPDLVFVLSSLDHGASEDMYQEEMESDDAWKSLSAYKNDQIHHLDYSTFGVTSLNNVDKALTDIADYFKEQ
ncbi:MAG TPA: ABC transporter substrate-binding protein [Bacillota bacterium]|nr:ABC transporter substrate-binding protein [Bacillota bacterium]